MKNKDYIKQKEREYLEDPVVAEYNKLSAEQEHALNKLREALWNHHTKQITQEELYTYQKDYHETETKLNNFLERDLTN